MKKAIWIITVSLSLVAMALVVKFACIGPAGQVFNDGMYDEQRTLRITVDGQVFVLGAGQACVWQKPVFNVQSSVVFVVKERVGKGHHTWPETMFKITKQGVVDMGSVDGYGGSNTVNTVRQLHAVSSSGTRVLATLWYESDRTGGAIQYSTRPVILDTVSRHAEDVNIDN